MVRECRPRERELSILKLERRSTMRTPVPASVSSAASIIPVGPPPAITTACSDIHHSSFPNVCQETLASAARWTCGDYVPSYRWRCQLAWFASESRVTLGQLGPSPEEGRPSGRPTPLLGCLSAAR